MVLLTETHQFSLGQTTLEAVSEQVRRQLQGQRTYFLPEGGGAMGWERETRRATRLGRWSCYSISVITTSLQLSSHRHGNKFFFPVTEMYRGSRSSLVS